VQLHVVAPGLELVEGGRTGLAHQKQESLTNQ
jgi:hypothetical protein